MLLNLPIISIPSGNSMLGTFYNIRQQINDIPSSILLISAKTLEGYGYDPSTTTNYALSNIGWISSEDTLNITYIFTGYEIEITHYSVMNGGLSSTLWSYPTGWILEAYKSTNWEIIDERSGIQFCPGTHCSAPSPRTFECTKKGTYSIFRLTQTSHSNSFQGFPFKAFEVFGRFQQKSQQAYCSMNGVVAHYEFKLHLSFIIIAFSLF